MGLGLSISADAPWRVRLSLWARTLRRPRHVVARLAITVGVTSLLAVVGAVGALAVTPKAPFAASAAARLPPGALSSNAAFARLLAGADPVALRLAERFDPAAARHEPPPAWAGVEQAAVTAPPVFKLQDVAPDQAVLINDSIPFSSAPNPAARPFVLKTQDRQARAEAEQCLTAAIYYEAGAESDPGQAAVAQVVLNRLRNPLFPKTVCGVVFQGALQTTGCQFTFTCDGSLNRTPNPDAWARAQRAADRALNGYVEKQVGEATHYHANYVAPYWNTALVKLTQIGVHIFYRWDGPLGRPSAFSMDYAGTEGADWELAKAKLVKVSAPVVIAAPAEAAPQISAVKAPTLLAAEPLVVASLEVQKTRMAALAKVTAPSLDTTIQEAPRPRLIAAPTNW